MRKDLPICLVKHSSAKRIVLSFFRYDHPRMKEDKLLNMKTDFVICFNEEEGYREATVKDLLKMVRKVGLWGFCNHRNVKEKEIHYWIGKRACDDDILELFHHELIHAAGYSSERTACLFSGLAKYAYNILREDIRGEKIETSGKKTVLRLKKRVIVERRDARVD